MKLTSHPERRRARHDERRAGGRIGRRPGRWALVVVVALALAFARQAAAQVGGAAFDRAVADLRDGDALDAARGFHAFWEGAEPGEKKAWAELLLGVALADAGFTHGAVAHYVEVARDRAVPELLPEALRRLRARIDAGPVLVAMVLDRVVLDADFGYLDPALADWIRLEKARESYRGGDVAWAERELTRLSEGSAAREEAQLLRALWHAARGDLVAAEARARAALRALGELAPDAGAAGAALAPPDAAPQDPAPDAPSTQALVRSLWRTLGRVLYERQRYEEAQAAYDHLTPGLAPDDARLLLEKAWTAYFLADPRTALGHLYALDAPSYRGVFLPERFVLAGLTYKNLCHYDRAQGAVEAFRGRFGRLIEAVRARRPIADDPVVRRVVATDDTVRPLLALAQTLADEREDAQDLGGPLGAHLVRVYDAAVAVAGARLEQARTAAVREFERELLHFDEQMNLLAYEVDLDRHRRTLGEDYLARGPQEAPPVPLWGTATWFPADGEYWNDELNLYRVHIDDRCARPRPWE